MYALSIGPLAHVFIPLLAIDGVAREEPGARRDAALREDPREKDEVEPATPLEADLGQPRALDEAEPLVQAPRALVLRVHAGDHRVDAARPRALDERLDQRRADALPAAVRADVDRVLDGEAVSRPAAEVAEAAEPAMPASSRATSTGKPRARRRRTSAGGSPATPGRR